MFLLLFFSCTPSNLPDSADTAIFDEFCSVFAEAGDTRLEDGSGDSTSSGQIQGQFVQDVLVDARDPQFVAFVDYLLENVDVGGQATRGRTDAVGRFTATLGQGNWQIKTSGHQGSYYCAQESTFAIVAGKVTLLCVDMNCE